MRPAAVSWAVLACLSGQRPHVRVCSCTRVRSLHWPCTCVRLPSHPSVVLLWSPCRSLRHLSAPGAQAPVWPRLTEPSAVDALLCAVHSHHCPRGPLSAGATVLGGHCPRGSLSMAVTVRRGQAALPFRAVQTVSIQCDHQHGGFGTCHCIVLCLRRLVCPFISPFLLSFGLFLFFFCILFEVVYWRLAFHDMSSWHLWV